MKKNEFRNKIYKAIIGEVEQREHKGAYRGNGHHLAQKLTELIDAEFKGVIMTNAPTADTRREQRKTAFDEIAGDLTDMDAYMKNIDRHIQWLGAALPKESVNIPEFKAAVETLNRVSARIAAVGIILSDE